MPKAKVSMVRPIVVSFRVTAKTAKLLEAILDRNPVIGIKSINQYARKILSDYTNGRMKHLDPKDMLADLDTVV